jgi:hypothetical protein
MKSFLLFLILILSVYQALASDPIGKYTVTVNVLNIRDAPNGKVIGKLNKEEGVNVYVNQGSWSRISTDSEPSKWVSTSSLRTVNSDKVVSSSSKSSHSTYLTPSTQNRSNANSYSSNNCSCSSGAVCFGPRGGRYCITSGGNKRYIGR